MSSGQAITLELLVVLGVLIVFASGAGRGFWTTLFTRTPYVVPPLQIGLPSLSLPGGVTLNSGKLVG